MYLSWFALPYQYFSGLDSTRFPARGEASDSSCAESRENVFGRFVQGKRGVHGLPYPPIHIPSEAERLRTSICPLRARTSKHGCGWTAGPSSTRPSFNANREE